MTTGGIIWVVPALFFWGIAAVTFAAVIFGAAQLTALGQQKTPPSPLGLGR